MSLGRAIALGSEVLSKPLVDVTVEKSNISCKLRLLLFPYNITLQTSFGTSHSQSDTRQNALALIIIYPTEENVGACYGVAEAGLPPKKKNVYEADINDLKTYFQNFLNTLIAFTTATADNYSDSNDQNQLRGQQTPLLFEGLEDLFHKKPMDIFFEMTDDKVKSLPVKTFKLLFNALDYCEENNDTAKPFIRCGKSLVESLIFDCYGKFSNTLVGNFFAIPNEKPSHQTFYTAAMNPEIDEIVKAAIFGYKHTENLKIKLNSDVELTRNILNRLNSANGLFVDSNDDKNSFSGVGGTVRKNWSIDANCSWTPEICKQMLSEVLHKYKDRIYMVEQPFPVDFLQMGAETLESWKNVKQEYNKHGILFFADESMRNAVDVKKLAPFVDGVNIKFEKCGGYREALLAVKEARKYDLLIWFGCMVGSNLNSTATSHLFSLSCCSDLDGALLVTETSKLFNGGFKIRNSSIVLPENVHGVGVTSKQVFFDELDKLDLFHEEGGTKKLLGDFLRTI